MFSSTASRLSASRSSVRLASIVTFSGSQFRVSATIFFISSKLIIIKISFVLLEGVLYFS